MNTTTCYAIRWQNLWWCGREYGEGNVERVGAPSLSNAYFFTNENLAEDVAQELGGVVRRVDLVTE